MESPAHVDPAAVRSELERVLASTTFASSDRLSRFLRYVVEETVAGRGNAIKEYSIGLAAYDKPADYDPKLDATVRGEASRLRSKLREYYHQRQDTPGSLKIDVPKGGYVPAFTSGPRFAPGIAAEGPPVRSLAVLPFVLLSASVDERAKALGLAIADALITGMASSGELLVRATSAVRKYLDLKADATEAARELQVEAIVEGHFQRVGERIRVSMQLIRAADGRHLLAESCDGNVMDIFSVQDQLVGLLSRALSLPQPKANVSPHTTSPGARHECHTQYAIGRFHFMKAAPDATPKAIRAFRAAVAADPTFAPAHAHLAFALSQTADFFLTTYSEVCSGMSEAADRAIALDPSLPESIAALGLVQHRCQWEWLVAAETFGRAIHRRPASAEIYVYGARVLDALGQSAEAARLCAKALELDATSSFAYIWLSFSHWFQRRYDDSVKWAHKALELNPQNPIAIGRLMEAHYMSENYTAWASLLKTVLPFWGIPVDGSILEDALRSGGPRGLVRCYLDLSRADSRGNQAWWLAFYYSEVGDLESAFACLERALADRASMLAYLKVDPRWDRIRNEPRFEELIRRVRLP